MPRPLFPTMSVSTEVTPLGVGGAIPARGRHLSGLALRREGRLLLFDCGEGTQLQLLRAGLLGGKLEAIFVTHLHGDHLFGLPGLISTLGLQDRQRPLAIVGPKGLRDFIGAVPGITFGDGPFRLDITELPKSATHEVVYATDDFRVEARPLAHRVPCFGYRYQETPRAGVFDAQAAIAAGVTPGPDFRTLAEGESVSVDGREVLPHAIVGPERPGTAIAYCLDTAPCDGDRALASGADLLIHDATFGDDDAARAEQTGHSTARQAAEVAAASGARGLLLTHFSARYTDLRGLVAEAREVFPHAHAAEELKTVEVFPPEA